MGSKWAATCVLLVFLVLSLGHGSLGTADRQRRVFSRRVSAAQTLGSHEKRLGLHLLKAYHRRHRLQAKEDGEEELPPCEGLTEKMCVPCPEQQGGPEGFCKDVKKMCADLFCRPMCIRNTWKCSVSFGSFSAEAGDKQYEGALCAQFLAKGCIETLKCCPDNEDLYDTYIENFAYYDQYPDPRFPTPGCIEGPSGELCGKCQGAVKVNLEALDCAYPTPEGDDAAKSLLEVMARVDPDYPGINAHKSLQERCKKLKEKVEAKIGSMKSEFQDNVCKCMGCCEGECFFPVTEQFPPGEQ